MTVTGFTKEQVIELLKQNHSLAYFYLEGGVAVQMESGAPIMGGYCPIGTFLELRSEGLIEQTEDKQHGYPFYANHSKYAVYKITDKGLLQ